MRKVLVGIAAGLMLATLVIAIVPAFAGDPGMLFTTSDLNYELVVDPVTHEFTLSSADYPGLSCHGVGAVIVKGVLAIGGKCQTLVIAQPGNLGATNGASGLPVAFLYGGGKVLTGPIRLVLVIVSTPPTKPMTFTLWPYSG